MLSKLSQSLKAVSLITVTLSGIFMLFKLLHPEKALVPILVTLSGIVMLSKSVYSKNSSSLIFVVPSGTVILTTPRPCPSDSISIAPIPALKIKKPPQSTAAAATAYFIPDFFVLASALSSFFSVLSLSFAPHSGQTSTPVSSFRLKPHFGQYMLVPLF